MKVTKGKIEKLGIGTVLMLSTEEFVRIISPYEGVIGAYKVQFLEMDGDGSYIPTGEERYMRATDLIGAETDE